jgi:hypothetical protein
MKEIIIDEIELAKLLDDLIEEREPILALTKLREVRDTFSRYNEYMAKIGLLIK